MHAFHRLIFVVGAVCAAIAAAQEIPERAITFPANVSLGKIETVDAASHEACWWAWNDSSVEAVGRVVIPADRMWRLEAGPSLQADPALLDKVPADALEALSITDWTAHEMTRLCERLPRFRHLSNLDLKDVNMNGVDVGPLEGMPQLADLVLSSKTTGEQALARIARLKQIRRLNVSAEEGVTKAALDHIAAMDGLEWLALCSRKIDGPGLAALARLKGLDSLTLFGTPTVTAEGYSNLAALASLRSLSLGNLDVTPKELALLAKHPSLERLSMRDTSDEHLAAIAPMLSLKVLRLEITMQNTRSLISETGFATLAGLRNLEDLEIVSRGTASDAGLAALASLPKLRRLSIANLDALTDEQMAYFARMAALEELTIGGRQITDQGLAKLEELKSLKKLRLVPTTKVTPDGVARLQHAIPGVEVVRGLNPRPAL